jgi:probable rRNA maturation factor
MSAPAAILFGLEDPGWPEALEARLTEAAEAALAAALPGRTLAVELGLTLADDAAVQDLNREHRGKDRPTNVLSFPLADDILGHGLPPPPAPGVPVMLGDLILARETCAAEAAAQGKPLSDHAAHLVVHGVLHLLGHDHETDAMAEAMERLEIAILSGLGIADPYAGGASSPTPESNPVKPEPP